MIRSTWHSAALAAVTFAALAGTPASAAAAAEPAVPELVRCEAPIGSVALVEGDQAGWSGWGLGSPRNLIVTLAEESNCFPVDNPADAVPAQFLVTLIAGSQEQVDKGMALPKTAATDALVRSGAAGSVLGGVPMGGAVLGMFGGFGGKKKTVAAGLRVVSPGNGLTIASGQGVVRESSISFGGGWAIGAADAAGYGTSKDGKMLIEAFIIAFNALIGQRQGLFVEVKDSFGTTGWVSVEELK